MATACATCTTSIGESYRAILILKVKASKGENCTVITGIPDEKRGFVVKATVVLREGYTGDLAMTNELREFVKNKTADYKAPRIICYTDKLPRTFSGKVRHAEIRARDAGK